MFQTYWQIGSDTTQFWSSKDNGFVAASNTDYVMWRNAGGRVTIVGAIFQAMRVVIIQTGLLENSDTTMLRIAEAVALGDTSWTASDVVAWVNWRRALRAIMNGSDTVSTSIPSRPSYPEGT